jgi:hypothetical protein
MNSKDWYRGLEHPESLGAVEAAWLKQAVDEYPYSAPLHALYARALKNEGHYLAPQALRRAAAVAPDRRALMVWMEDFSTPSVFDVPPLSETDAAEPTVFEVPTVPQTIPAVAMDFSPEVVPAPRAEPVAKPESSATGSDVSHLPEKVQEAILRARALSAKLHGPKPVVSAPAEERQESVAPALQSVAPVSPTHAIAPSDVAANSGLSPFARWLAEQTVGAPQTSPSGAPELDEALQEAVQASLPSDAVVSAPTVPKPMADALIDKFLEREAPVRPAAVPGRGSEVRAPMPDLSASSLGGDPVFMTETLAQVYVQQGAFDKAVQAYEILRLKYPDKSAIFASLILEIRLKQRNKKP